MNEKGKDFIFYNKPYICLQEALHMAMATVALPAAAWAGVEGCMYSNIIFSFTLNE